MTIAHVETPGRTAPAARKPWRFRRLRWSAVVVVLLGLTWCLSYADSYSPLQPGSLKNVYPASRLQAYGDNRDVDVLPFRPGVDQSLTFTIANRGRWAVTIDGVEVNHDLLFFDISGATAFLTGHPQPVGRATSFPYHLAPGQELGLRVSYRLQGCELAQDDQSSSAIEGLPVVWHAFGRHHVSQVATDIVVMNIPASVPASSTGPCPNLS